MNDNIILDLIRQNLIVVALAYYVFMAIVSAIEKPNEQDGRAYRMLYTFLNVLAGNLKNAYDHYVPTPNKPKG